MKQKAQSTPDQAVACTGLLGWQKMILDGVKPTISEELKAEIDKWVYSARKSGIRQTDRAALETEKPKQDPNLHFQVEKANVGLAQTEVVHHDGKKLAESYIRISYEIVTCPNVQADPHGPKGAE